MRHSGSLLPHSCHFPSAPPSYLLDVPNPIQLSNSQICNSQIAASSLLASSSLSHAFSLTDGDRISPLDRDNVMLADKKIADRRSLTC